MKKLKYNKKYGPDSFLKINVSLVVVENDTSPGNHDYLWLEFFADVPSKWWDILPLRAKRLKKKTQNNNGHKSITRFNHEQKDPSSRDHELILMFFVIL